MHLVFLSHYFPPEVNAPASRTFEHARVWAQDPGTRVSVITNHPNHPYGVLYPGYTNRWVTREQVDGIDVWRVKTYLAPNAGFGPRILNYLFFMLMAVLVARRLARPDVVVATSPQFFCALAGYLVGRLRACPFVFELRDIWPESIVTVGALKTPFIIRALERLELFLYRQARLVISVTDAFKANLIQRGIPADKIIVIKNGVDLTFFSPREAPPALRQTLGAQGKFVASYIGTVGMAHAVDNIVAAAELLRAHDDILFLVVGEGAHKQALQNLVAEKNLPNFKVLPGVDKNTVRDYYALTDLNLVTLKKADLFRTVIPSKIFEIMAMQRPILTTVDGECRHIIASAGSGCFVEPDQPALLAEAILRLQQQPELLQDMAAHGRLFVEQHFSRPQLAQFYLSTLKNLVNGI